MPCPTPARRALCPSCARPKTTCICSFATLVAHQVEVLVLQHPLEVNNAKGTARLLHLCLPHSSLVTGEQFAPQVLQDLLDGSGPGRSHAPAHSAKQTVLLYPDTPQELGMGMGDSMAQPLAVPPALTLPLEPARLRLVVLDGTWRKSRKMLYLNPLLQQLPRLALTDVAASRYRIRKAHRAHQLSTLEAVHAALVQLEGDARALQPLLTAFDAFVAQQMLRVGVGVVAPLA